MAALAGCGSISSTLGLERHVPDETQVVVRPALTLPPDYSLMPPGTETPVSADHEGARSISGANDMAPVPPKEEKGFISRVFSFDWFGDDSDSDVPKSPAPSVEGTPAAPDAAPPAAPPAKP
jgi:hypothetical protein